MRISTNHSAGGKNTVEQEASPKHFKNGRRLKGI